MKKLAWLVAPALVVISTVANAAPTKSFTAATSSLPADMEILGSSNVKALRSTEVFKKVFPQLLKTDKDIPEGLDKVKKQCGIDPVTAIDDVTVGLDSKEKGAFFIAVNGVTEQKLVDCIVKLGKSEKETITSKKIGNLTELKGDKGNTIYFAWLTGDVLVIASEPEDKATLERMLGGKGALTKSGKLAGRIAKATPDAALTVMWAKSFPIEKMTLKSGDLTLSDVAGQVTAATSLEMASAKEAEQLVDAAKTVQKLLPLPKDAPKEIDKILKTLDAKASGAEAKISVQSSEKDLMTVIQWALDQAMPKKAPPATSRGR